MTEPKFWDSEDGQFRDILRRLERLEKSPRLYGPFTTAAVGPIAAGTDATATHNHNLALGNPDNCRVMAHLEDGSWASLVSWRAVISTNSVQFVLRNPGPNTATVVVKYAISEF